MYTMDMNVPPKSLDWMITWAWLSNNNNESQHQIHGHILIVEDTRVRLQDIKSERDGHCVKLGDHRVINDRLMADNTLNPDHSELSWLVWCIEVINKVPRIDCTVVADSINIAYAIQRKTKHVCSVHSITLCIKSLENY